MTNDGATKYQYLPASKRPPDDKSTAVSAFQRLYKYGRKSGNPALAVFAVYKALQKLDKNRNSDAEDENDACLRPGPIEVPAWVHAGL